MPLRSCITAITPILKDWKFLSTFYLNSNIVTIFLFSGGYSWNTSFWSRIFNGRIRSRKIRLQLISNFFVYSCHFKTNFTQTAFWQISIQSQSVVKILWRSEVNRFKGDWKLSPCMYEKAKLPIFTIERTELNLKAKFALVVALLIISFDN